MQNCACQSRHRPIAADIMRSPFGRAFAIWARDNGGDPDQAESSTVYWVDGAWSVQFTLQPDCVVIDMIDVEEGADGQGLGGSILKALCAAANATATPLELVAAHGGDADRHWLIGWYERHGFTRVGPLCDHGPLMRREPNPARQ